jgi:hypothetical protein
MNGSAKALCTGLPKRDVVPIASIVGEFLLTTLYLAPTRRTATAQRSCRLIGLRAHFGSEGHIVKLSHSIEHNAPLS